MKRIIAYALVFLLVFSCELRSQNSLFSVKHYTAGDGLPSGIVQDIAWDSNGFMWISSLKGMARFDGVWIRSFTRKNVPGISSEFSSPLTMDENGKLIFCDNIGNIYGFKNWTPVLQDTSYRVGLMTDNYFAFPLPSRFRDPVFTHYSDSFKISNEPILIDSNHFILAVGKKLLLYDQLSRTYTTIKKFPKLVKIFKMGHAIYLYEKGQLFYKMEFTGTENRLLLKHADITFPVVDAQIYWRNGMEEAILAENRHAYLLHLQDGRFIEELICDDLPNDIFVTNIKYNPLTRTTAIATDGDGIYIYKRKLLRTYARQSSNVLSTPFSCYSQIEMQPGLLWLNTEMNVNINKSNYTIADRQPFVSAYRIRDSVALFHQIIENKEYSVWSYSFRTKKFTKRFETKATESGSFAMTQNRLFFASDNGLIEMTRKEDSVFFRFNVRGRNTVDMARDMIEYKPGYLVFCGAVGAYGFDIHAKRLDTLVSAAGNGMFRGITSYKGYLILAEYNYGICILKDRTDKLLALDRRQYLQTVHNIFIDPNRIAWISCNAGIFKISADSLIGQFNRAGNDSSYYLKCAYYGKDDGLDIPELNGGRQGSVIQLGNGLLSYAGINGIVTVDISSIDSFGQDAKIIPDRMIVDNRTIPDTAFHSRMKFSPDASTIKIYFNVPVWTNPHNMITEYRLLGYSGQWEEIDYTKQNYIELKHLRSGDYTLQVRASPSIDGSRGAEFYFSFEIATPWYKTVLFNFLVGILLLLAVVAIFRWRVYYLKQKNKTLSRLVTQQVEAINLQKMELEKYITDMEAYQETLEKDYALKNRLISIIGHDIITPLRFMNRAGKLLLTRKESINQETFDDTLKTILDTGTGLQDMAVNMLNWIKHHQETMQFILSDFHVNEKIDEIIQQVKPMAEFKQLTINNRVPMGLAVHQYCDPFKTILIQILTNSIKYTENGSIFVDAEKSDRQILVSVADEGVGMPSNKINQLINSDKTVDFTYAHENSGHGFGFLIIRDMLEVMKGQMGIESTISHGTKVTISFPAIMES